MTTQAELMETVARDGGPEAAGVLAMVFDQQARDREVLMPTWEALKRERDDAYRQGYEQGRFDAEQAIINRLLGYRDREES